MVVRAIPPSGGTRSGSTWMTWGKLSVAQQDFHGQRVTFITQLAQTGNSAAAVQKLARHSDYNLTQRIYTRLQIQDLVAAVGKLSSLSDSSKGETAVEPAADSAPDAAEDPRLRNLVQAWPSLSEHVKAAISLLAVPPSQEER
jgi:hypothetical protein